MMRENKREGALLDGFRLVCAFLIVAIHTSPLTSVSGTADFVLTRVFARVAVPFFFMVSGYFMAPHLRADDREYRNRFLKKIGKIYLAAMLLYLPLNLYTGYFKEGWSAGKMLLDVLINGTFYHLWYLPAVMLGTWLSWEMYRRLGQKRAFGLALGLYLVGLFGDSYYGLSAWLPGVRQGYEILFSFSDYTRNGLFFAPVFLLMGAGCAEEEMPPAGKSAAELALCLGLMTAEGLILHHFALQRHDSMYLFLVPCMYALFQLLRAGNRGERKAVRELSLWVYLLHPWTIVAVRGAAKVLGLQAILVENSLGHYLAVCGATLAAAWILSRARRGIRKSGRFAGQTGGEDASSRCRSWLEINEAAIAHNVREIRRLLPDTTEIMGVLKADAYGHGAVPAARTLEKEGVRYFAVACLTEGIALRRAGIRGEILILGWTDPKEAACLARYRLTQTVVDLPYARVLERRGIPLKVQIKIDTGMHRLGVADDRYEEVTRIFRCRNLTVTGTFSHLNASDSLTPEDVDYTEGQIRRFFAVVDRLKTEGYPVGQVHIQASYGILNWPELDCDAARAGLILYGIKSDTMPVRHELALTPALSWKAKLGLIRPVAAGETAGYGRAFLAKRPCLLGVVTVGYGDGLMRHYGQQGGQVLLRGTRVPIVGRICMDQMLIDVTEVPDCRPGDIVTLIGRDGQEEITCEEMAEICGTITNEIVSGLGKRLPKCY